MRWMCRDTPRVCSNVQFAFEPRMSTAGRSTRGEHNVADATRNFIACDTIALLLNYVTFADAPSPCIPARCNAMHSTCVGSSRHRYFGKFRRGGRLRGGGGMEIGSFHVLRHPRYLAARLWDRLKLISAFCRVHLHTDPTAASRC